MTLVDVNILIYAINRDAPHHECCREWLESALSGRTPVGLSWLVLLGFLRITTHPRIMPRPLSVHEATMIVDGWLACPAVRILEPSERHWEILKDLLDALGTAANITSDAHLAAMAIEYGARLCSTDNDFARFPGLKWLNPLVEVDSGSK